MTDRTRQNRQDDERKPKPPSTSRWEWAAAAVGSILVAAIMGYMIYFGVTEHGKVPEIEIQVAEIAPSSSGYVVRLRAVNRGGATAAALRIRGELRRGDAVVEDADTELDYVPPHSERTASLIFRNDPGSGEFRIAPTSYTDP
jgi:uncharacterized protein (TIGR02588 family)